MSPIPPTAAARIVAAASTGPEAVDAALAAARLTTGDEAVVAELEAVAREAHALAHALAVARTDPLTGLPHRGALAQAPPADAVLAVDVDGLKATNDAHGHAAGDALLEAVADRLREALRRGDAVYRTGGDEFTVLLGQTDPEAARAIAERLREAVTAGTAATVSIGVAIRRAGDTPEAVRERADTALYAAKAAGRDRVHVAPG